MSNILSAPSPPHTPVRNFRLSKIKFALKYKSMGLGRSLLKAGANYLSSGLDVVRKPDINRDQILEGHIRFLSGILGKGAEHNVYKTTIGTALKIANLLGLIWQPNSAEAKAGDHQTLQYVIDKMAQQYPDFAMGLYPHKYHSCVWTTKKIADNFYEPLTPDRHRAGVETPYNPDFADEVFTLRDFADNQNLQRQIYYMIVMAGKLQQQHQRGLDPHGGEVLGDLMKCLMPEMIRAIHDKMPVEIQKLMARLNLLPENGVEAKMRNILLAKKDHKYTKEQAEIFGAREGDAYMKKGKLYFADSGMHNLQMDMPAYARPIIYFLNQMMIASLVILLRDLNPQYRNESYEFESNPLIYQITEKLYKKFFRPQSRLFLKKKPRPEVPSEGSGATKHLKASSSQIAIA